MKRLFPSIVLFGVSALALIACSATDRDGDSSDDALRIKPTATENWASLTIQLPTNVCQPGQSCSRPLGANADVQIDGAAVSIGAKNRLKPGAHTLSVNGTTAQVTLTGGQARTLVLPVAHRKCQAASLPTVAQTDFGKTITLANATCPSNVQPTSSTTAPTIELHWYNWSCPAGNVAGTLSSSTKSADCGALGSNQIYSIVVNGRCIDLNTNGMYGINPQTACTRYLAGDYSWASIQSPAFRDTDLAYAPGDYVANIAEAGATKSFTLNEGDTSEITVDLPVVGSVPATFAVDVSFADARELPDALNASISSSCGGERGYAVPAGTTSTLHLKAFQNTGCTYTLSAAGRSVTLDQSQKNAFTLHRVDVDNPVVTREDGSTYTTTGTYELYFGGNRVAGPLNTNTGIDVLPGSYELVTKFSTADGPQTQHQTFTL